MFTTAATKVPARAPFRLRPVRLPAPVGRQAFLAHGEARLPGLLLREGDVLCVGGPAAPGAVEVFAPVVAGHPMLGQVVRQQLRSLPGGIPCATRHWESLGALQAVWRSLGEPMPFGVAPRDGASPDPAPRIVCVRVPAPAVGLVRAAHPEWLGRPMQLVEDGPRPALVFPGLGGSEPVPAAPPSASALDAVAARIAEELGVGAEIEQASPTELRVVARLSLDLRAATALAHRLGRHLRLPLSLAVADDRHEARRLAWRLAPDQLLYVLPGGAAHERAAGEQADSEQAAPELPPRPPRVPALSLAPVPPPVPALRRALRLAPPVEGPVQLSLFGGEEAA
ncbi:MAG: hypothetical protein ABIO70_29500 [Pseudomonadota bacterium]